MNRYLPQSSSQVFKADLAQSFKALRSDVRLPLLTLALVVIQYIPSAFPLDAQQIVSWIVIPVSIFYLGYVGTERIWLARLFHGETLNFRGIWSWSWHLWPRFFALWLLMMLFFLPLLIPIVIESFQVATELAEEVRRTGETFEQDPEELARRFLTPTLLVLAIAMGLLMDFALTFATPALAMSRLGPGQALKENLRIIRKQFPTSLFYVLIPPLAALITIRFLPVTALGTPLYIGLASVGALLILWFKGATLAFYLRASQSESAPPAT
jgi:membrane-anchored glycerophosphoryl diester phosphodiesterase (GDPDase)